MTLEEELRLKLFKAREPFEKAVEDRFSGEDQELMRCRGIQYFKRRVLGLCGKKRIMTLDELSNIFIEIGMADTPCHSREVVFNVKGFQLNYGSFRYVRVDEIKPEGKTRYRVSAGKYY